MPRFYLPPAAWDPARLILTGAEAHHCLDVMRMKAGDRATVFDGQGNVAEVEILSGRRGEVECRVLDTIAAPPPACRITLAQAIPKGKNMEFVIEKATELGVSAIVPLLTARTVVQLDAGDAARKREKWQRIALEAAKQCGQNWLPEVAPPQTPAAFFEKTPAFDLMLIGSLEPDARLLKGLLAEKGPGKISSALVLIGPEGDFTPAEMASAKEYGCRPITFGPIILRTETAAIYSLSVLSHELLGG
ncbi:MAG: 16S rRNA (uracil(1498)-N(3))-methyltransferase [Verrucomicrobiota bacterium]